eukprot:TRINITY_DN6321_c0_g1_i1.p1 TRINITY_DN6321_c0_g1~~TRINITY_DN6321_c0_g1_i1.p1  ORF type:complete len:938 (-),score=485.54 TRINITY_DN6321_c0_g1_i1:68-2812(-)
MAEDYGTRDDRDDFAGTSSFVLDDSYEESSRGPSKQSLGYILRSRPMTHIQMFLQRDVARETVARLGDEGLVQFRDLNPNTSAFHRTFVSEVKRCDELERKLRFFEEHVHQAIEGGVLDATAVDADGPADSLSLSGSGSGHGGAEMDLDQLETYFEELHGSLLELTGNDMLLTREFCKYVEMRQVLLKNRQFLEDAEDDAEQELAPEAGAAGLPREVRLVNTDLLTGGMPGSAADDAAALGDLEEGIGGASAENDQRTKSGSGVGYLTGTLPADKLPSLERVLFRATRGNMLLRHSEIERAIIDPNTGAEVQKIVYIVFFHGAAMRRRIARVCDSLGANAYSCPRARRAWDARLSAVLGKLTELRTVVRHTTDSKRQVLGGVAAQLGGWQRRLCREKACYHTMNLFAQDQVRRCLIAEGWCAVADLGRVAAALKAAAEARGEHVPSILREKSTRLPPPTYFPSNKFTKPYQAIIDAYGMATYGEINPAVFTMVTFPFLFAVMFGDLGHGSLMTLYAIYLIRNENKWNVKNMPEMIRMTFHGRYMLILMGLFAMYTGLLYNEFFSLPIDIFGSNWTFPGGTETEGSMAVQVTPGSPYPFGVDPVWHGKSNDLVFSNSLKMKLSIILGVSQMIMGVILSLFNHLHFKDRRSIICEFIPQVIYLCGIFGYLVIAVFIKWGTNWAPETGNGTPPSLTNMLIKMFLAPGSVPASEQLYPGQAVIQAILVVLAVVAIPWMLVPKPFLIRRDHRRKTQPHYQPLLDGETPASESSVGSTSGGGGGEHGDEHGEEFDFTELFVHQVIHTIEFVLGGVSHTASYLRLWALSLAHAQLAAVFWDKLMGMTVGTGNPVMVVVGYGAWGGATVGIVICMEGLSSFLHALRLHWVEFNSKFFKGEGYAFAPLSFEKLYDQLDDPESA